MKLHNNGQINIDQHGVHTLLDAEGSGKTLGWGTDHKATGEPQAGLTRKTKLQESVLCEHQRSRYYEKSLQFVSQRKM